MNRLARFVMVLALGTGAAGAASADGPNLVVNGDFESPVLANGTWDVYQAIDGWTTTSGPGIEVRNNVAGVAFSGSQFVELDSHGPSSMAQTVPTIPGVTYRFRFAYAPRVDCPDNEIVATWNGVPVAAINHPFDPNRASNWDVYEFAVVATGTTSIVGFHDTSLNDSLGACIDDVQVRMGQFDVVPLYKVGKAHPSPSTIPIKLQLWNGPVNVSSPGVLVMAGCIEDPVGNCWPVSDSGGSNPLNLFRYDPALQGYIFNLKVNLPPGVYLLKFCASTCDNVYTVPFVLK